MATNCTRREFLRIAGVAASAAVMAACGSPAPTAAPQPTSKPQAAEATKAPVVPTAKAVTGNVRWRTRPADAGEQAVYQQLNDEIAKKLQGISVTYDPAPVQGYLDKALAEFSAGTAPDIIWLPGASYSAYAAKGVLLDVMPYLQASSTLTPKSFYASVMNEMTHEGKIYGLPRDISTEVVYYNADLFKAKGLTDPCDLAAKDQWTWETFLSSAQALTTDENKDGVNDTWGCSITVWWATYWYFILAAGGNLWNKERTKCTLNTPEVVKGMQFMCDLFHTHKVAPAPGAQIDAAALFNTGKLGMVFSGRWSVPGLRKQAKGFTWNVVEMPKGPAGKATFLFWGPYAVAKSTKNPDATWKVLEQLCSVEAQIKIAELGTNIPSRDDETARQAVLKSTPPANNKAFFDGIPYATVEPAPWTVNMDELMWAHLDPAAQRVFTKEITPQKFADTICQELDPIFAKGLK
jgi:multiple sugar transport system substrate-binding protein